MKEADFVRMLKKNLRGCFHRNHGGPYGTAGLPDLEGCYLSRAYLIEAKIGHLGRNDRVVLKNKLTETQKHWLREYYNNGAISLLAVYLEDAKKTIFFSWREPWWLHVDSALTEIDFLEPKFVTSKVWTRSDEYTVNLINALSGGKDNDDR